MSGVGGGEHPSPIADLMVVGSGLHRAGQGVGLEEAAPGVEACSHVGSGVGKSPQRAAPSWATAVGVGASDADFEVRRNLEPRGPSLADCPR